MSEQVERVGGIEKIFFHIYSSAAPAAGVTGWVAAAEGTRVYSSSNAGKKSLSVIRSATIHNALGRTQAATALGDRSTVISRAAGRS